MPTKMPVKPGGRIGGAMLLLLGIVAGMSGGASAQTLTTLYSFAGGSDGANPTGGLIFDASGALYGTTAAGGGTDCSGYGCGTVFQLMPARGGGAWTEALLHSFSVSEGGNPAAALISDAAGASYGTTSNYGAGGGGTVFRLVPPATPGGVRTETVLHSFAGSDGSGPFDSLIADVSSGALYYGGVGGLNQCCGTVFQLTLAGVAWTETVLHSFTGGSDGANPYAGLISDTAGNLYGTTTQGGGLGTVFRLTPPAVPGGTWTPTVLYSFTGGSDGGYPVAGLISDASGALYGTTTVGGAFGRGTVFQLTPPAVSGGAWTETVLHSFAGGSDGANPRGGLISDASGALYGTTYNSGVAPAFCCGTVFQLTPPTTPGGAWTETILHSFAGSDGASPRAGLVADASGALYGTTEEGGANNQGTVFKLTVATSFIGVPGQANCKGQSISFLAKQYGGIAHAAASLGFPSVSDLQAAVATYCGG